MFHPLISAVVVSLKTRQALVLENLALRQQLSVLERSVKRPRLSVMDRLFRVLLSKLSSCWRELLHIVTPDTVVRWHRAGFRRYWAWKSRRRSPGRPLIDPEVPKLIRQM